MTRRNSLPLLLLTLGLCVPVYSQGDRIQAVKEGVDAFQNENYLKAAEAFQKALSREPNSDALNLYVGTAYATEFYRHGYSDGSSTAAQMAAASFRRVLQLSPDEPTAIASLGSLIYAQTRLIRSEDPKYAAGLNEAKGLFQRLVSMTPRDAMMFCFLGSIDADLATQVRRSVFEKAGLPYWYAEHPIRKATVRSELQNRVGSLYTSSIAHFNRALEIAPEYPQVMLNLAQVTAYKADLVATPAEYQRQTRGIDALQAKALSLSKAGVHGPVPSSKKMMITPAIECGLIAPPPPPPPTASSGSLEKGKS